MTYVAKAKVVKVAVGPASGNRVARIVRAGGVIPEGVEQKTLDALLKRGLIEATADEPADSEATGEPVKTRAPRGRGNAKKAEEDAAAAAAKAAEEQAAAAAAKAAEEQGAADGTAGEKEGASK